ncbi:hypothetical protein SBADM41S_10850 [Streptomyces badius]
MDVSLAASALMFASALWFVAELQSALAPGMAERVVTFLQALWPSWRSCPAGRRAAGLGSESGAGSRKGYAPAREALKGMSGPSTSRNSSGRWPAEVRWAR